MSVLPVYTYGAPVLKKKAQPVRQMTDQILQLIMDMFETMHKASGIGLAANQVGSLLRIIVVDISVLEETRDIKPIVLVNPEIVSQEGSCTMEEGCLSIPNVREEVERAEKILVRFKDANMQEVELEADGLLARVILHENDHLDGVMFPDRLLGAKRKLHAEELRKIQLGEMEVDYPVVTAIDIAA